MALSAAVLLSACSILPSQTPMDTYVLPAPVTQKTPASAGANTGLALRITRPLVDGAIAGRRIVVSALMREKGNVSAAARVLGISRATLYRRIRHLGLDKDLGRAIVSDLKQTRR